MRSDSYFYVPILILCDDGKYFPFFFLVVSLVEKAAAENGARLLHISKKKKPNKAKAH